MVGIAPTTQPALPLGALAPDRVLRGLHLLEDAPGARIERLPRLASAPLPRPCRWKSARPQPLLEALDLQRERGLGDPQRAGRAAQRSGVGGLEKGSEENAFMSNR